MHEAGRVYERVDPAQPTLQPVDRSGVSHVKVFGFNRGVGFTERLQPICIDVGSDYVRALACKGHSDRAADAGRRRRDQRCLTLQTHTYAFLPRVRSGAAGAHSPTSISFLGEDHCQ
jgi:hypothetical protein